MPNITSFSIFFLSFGPLWLSVILLDLKSIFIDRTEYQITEVLSIGLILVIAIISLLILLVAFNRKNSQGAQLYTIIAVEEEKTITSEFLLSYILPLFAFDFTLWHQVVLFILFFSVFAYLSVRHSHFSVNIVLELLQYRYYHCEILNEDAVKISKVIICQEILSARKGKDLRLRPINNEYMVVVE